MLFNRKAVADSAEYWRQNRNRFLGQRGFVVGNGPSLKMSDLGMLESEVSIASNKAYLAYPTTKWRPTLLTCGDKLVWSKIHSQLPREVDNVVILNTLPDYRSRCRQTILRMRGAFFGDAIGFSSDCGFGVYGGWTVTYINLQIAVHLGLNPIYLIGCDHYYSGEKGVEPNGGVVQHSGKSNHFIENYRVDGEKVHLAPIEMMTQAYTNALKWSKNNNVQIFNATRGGHLEVFPRICFEDVFR